MKKIEFENWTQKQKKLPSYREGTQKWKIMVLMASYPKRWWRPEDFMQYFLGEDLYVGYEANSRLAEITADNLADSVPVKEKTATWWKRSRKKVWRINPAVREAMLEAPAFKKAINKAKRTVKLRDFRNKYNPDDNYRPITE